MLVSRCAYLKKPYLKLWSHLSIPEHPLEIEIVCRFSKGQRFNQMLMHSCFSLSRNAVPLFVKRYRCQDSRRQTSPFCRRTKARHGNARASSRTAGAVGQQTIQSSTDNSAVFEASILQSIPTTASIMPRRNLFLSHPSFYSSMNSAVMAPQEETPMASPDASSLADFCSCRDELSRPMPGALYSPPSILSWAIVWQTSLHGQALPNAPLNWIVKFNGHA